MFSSKMKRELLYGENHRRSTSDTQRTRSVSLVDGNFQITARPKIRNRFARLATRKRIDQPVDRVGSHLHFQPAAVLCLAGQILGAEIRYQVPERIDFQYQTFDARRSRFRP